MKTPNNQIIEQIEAAAGISQRPDGSTYRFLSHDAECGIVQGGAATHHEVQHTALTAEIVPERYARNQRQLSTADQLRLLGAGVAVVGLGGLGGAVVEVLARIGVGHLTLIDGDHFADSNLNRQLLSSPAALGQNKAEVAARRVAELNPAVLTTTHTTMLTEDNRQGLLTGVDVVMDCLDSIGDRFVLEKGCRQCSVPLISAAIGGCAGQVTTIMASDPGLRLIYGDPQRRLHQGAERTMGTLPFAAMGIASAACGELVNIVAWGSPRLRGRLLVIDYGGFDADVIELAIASPNN